MPHQPHINAILFDLVGVLLFVREDYQADGLVDEINTLIGQVTNDDIFKAETLKKFHLNEKEFAEVIEKIVNKYEPYKPLWDLLPKLRESYKLAVINNGMALTLARFNDKFNFDQHFDFLASSAIEGIKKPDSRMFLTTASRLKVAPDKCLFMDDSEINIEGAKRVGMQTIFWKNKEQGFEEFLKFLKLAP